MPAAGSPDRSRIASVRRWTWRSRPTGGRSGRREDLATEREVLAVPAVADPHDRDAAGRAAGVEPVPVADVRVDVVDQAGSVPLVKRLGVRPAVAGGHSRGRLLRL